MPRKATARRNGHRPVRKADLPVIESPADLSPLGQELFALAEKIRRESSEQLLTARQIKAEIFRRRGGAGA